MDDGSVCRGASGRDDIEVHTVVLGGIVDWLPKEFFALEEEFLAFVVELGDFLNAGERDFQDIGAWMLPGEFKGFLMEKVADDGLDARGLVQIALVFEVIDHVEHVVGTKHEIVGVQGIPKAEECGKVDGKSEALGGRTGDAAMNFGGVFDFAEPARDEHGSVDVDRVDEGVGALFCLKRLDPLSKGRGRRIRGLWQGWRQVSLFRHRVDGNRTRRRGVRLNRTTSDHLSKC